MGLTKTQIGSLWWLWTCLSSVHNLNPFRMTATEMESVGGCWLSSFQFPVKLIDISFHYSLVLSSLNPFFFHSQKENMQSNQHGVWMTKFSTFCIRFLPNWWKCVPKFVIFNMGDFFESRKMQSNRPSVKMAIIFTIFASISTKMVKIGWKMSSLHLLFKMIEVYYKFLIAKMSLKWCNKPIKILADCH